MNDNYLSFTDDDIESYDSDSDLSDEEPVVKFIFIISFWYS